MNDYALAEVDALDYLARFCIISPESRRDYNRAFDAVAGNCPAAGQTLNMNQVCVALTGLDVLRFTLPVSEANTSLAVPYRAVDARTSDHQQKSHHASGDGLRFIVCLNANLFGTFLKECYLMSSITISKPH